MPISGFIIMQCNIFIQQPLMCVLIKLVHLPNPKIYTVHFHTKSLGPKNLNLFKRLPL